MSRVYQLPGAVFIALLLAFNLNAAEIQPQKHLFITLVSGDFKQSGMGIAIANAMQKAGVLTTVLIGANSVKWVMKKGKQEAFGPTAQPISEMVASLVQRGGRVMLCGMCAKYLEIEPRDIIKGVDIVQGSDLYGALFAPDTQTLSF